MADRPLTPRQAKFIPAYVDTGNATEAARIAGYAGSDATLAVAGSRLVHHPAVALGIREHLNALGASVDVLVPKMLEIAMADWREFIQIKTRHGEIVDVKMDLSTQERALEFLLKTHGAGTEQIDVNVGFVPMRLVGVDIDKDL
jgi:phage terminase small subunit